MADRRLFTHPRQHFETTEERQLQIEQYQGWNRERLAIRVFAGAGEIVDCLLAISGEVDGVRYGSFLQSVMHKKYVIIAVFHEENDMALHNHRFSTAGSSIQKRLPVNPSDSTPAVPPIFSAAFRTIASPIPVP